MSNIYIIDLGGSIACPKEINVSYLLKFRKFIKNHTAKGDKFVIVIGGGFTARKYQKAGLKIGMSAKDRDWLGIGATKINAVLLKGMLGKNVHPKTFDERFKIKSFGRAKVIVASGWSPGWSTDYVSFQIASDLKIQRVIILGKPDHVYTSDFEKNKKAKPIDRISWKDYFKIIPKKWEPGMSAPVDPVAARLARKNGLQAVVASGYDLVNLEKILNKENFKGTLIQ